MNEKTKELKNKIIEYGLPLLTEIPRFLYNHKLGVFLVGFGSSVAVLYHKMRNSRKNQMIVVSKEKVAQFFEKSQQFSNNTVQFIISNFLIQKKILDEYIDITSISLKIRCASTPEEKKMFTDELGYSIISRLYTTLYTIPLILLLNRIQINLIGKYCYLDYIIYQTEENRLINEKDEKTFISFSNYLFDYKFRYFIEMIKSEVTDELKNWKLDQQSTYEGILMLLLRIRNRFESKKILLTLNDKKSEIGINEKSMLNYLIPTETDQVRYDETIRHLLDEVRNIFEDDKFYRVLSDSINTSFLWFTKSLRTVFESSSPQIPEVIESNPYVPFEIEIPKPLNMLHHLQLLPKINKMVNEVLSPDSTIIQQIIQNSSDQPAFQEFNYKILTNNINFNQLKF
ncbi:transmembrane protein [Tieghemostelium lacteum]|uniref:Transmembrane protein n=1 Tax=Tieghemostelium lacteum TaxID=361077 RepID=A0A151ZCB9_TIELA|nr:transmembrane protein [Tieghemostelium lacteum]|eukprot:KYQ91590.1 transmembrane protein [Tieghemostelium lacteum]